MSRVGLFRERITLKQEANDGTSDGIGGTTPGTETTLGIYYASVERMSATYAVQMNAPVNWQVYRIRMRGKYDDRIQNKKFWIEYGTKRLTVHKITDKSMGQEKTIEIIAHEQT